MQRITVILLWSAGGVIGMFGVVLLLLSVAHFFLPTEAIKERAPLVASAVTRVFGPEQRDYPRGQPLDAMQRWYDQCYADGKIEPWAFSSRLA
jgi:hypothetical protein